jgi:enamine deaminase RidA (YjgF/YER057c/UK114 family)
MKTRILLIAGLWMIFSCGPSPAENQVNNAVEQADAGYNPEEKLTELGLTLDLPAAPAANYVNAVQSGNLVFLAGKGPRTADGQLVTGKLGEDMTVAEGYDAARLVGIAQLAVLKAELGNLKRVKRVVKVLGMVNATPDFTEQPEVVNGFSDLIVEVFGENGKHARAAVGMCSLPRNIAVEVEMVVEVWEEE